jgi:hypothetical protein
MNSLVVLAIVLAVCVSQWLWTQHLRYARRASHRSSDPAADNGVPARATPDARRRMNRTRPIPASP